MRWGIHLVLTCAVVATACAGDEETEVFTVRDEDGDSYDLRVTTADAEACFELDGGALGRWCGTPVGDVTTVEVVGSAGGGVQPEAEAEAVFDYAVVGVAPLETSSVRVTLGDTTRTVGVTEGDRYSAWFARFEETVPSEGPLDASPRPSISAEPAD
jgi:hypothetical protein